MKIGKKRFELACYKNKLLEYRSGAEKDLDNVLQVPTIFLSVSKAQTAPSAELTKAFGADYIADEIRQEILRKGEVQVGERERKEIAERVEKEVLDIVSGRLIDPTTKRVYTPGMISKALDQLTAASGQQQQQQQQQNGEDGAGEEHGAPAQPRKPLWTGVNPNKSAKSLALEAMKALIAWQPIPVMRARMRLRVTCPVSVLKQSVQSAPAAGGNKEKEAPSGGGSKNNKKGGKGKKSARNNDSDSEGEAAPVQPKGPSNVKDKILSFIESVESQEVASDEWEVVGFAEPGAFKGLNDFIGNETRGRGRVEVLDMAVTHED
ncbi:SBDS protein C-terminal domain-containing protein [Aspergillus unguis]